MKIKFRTILYYLGMFSLVVGYLFRIQHWSYGTQIIIGGLCLVGISALLAIFKSSK